MAWTFDSGTCYDGNETVESLTQLDVFELGKFYFVTITIADIDQGGLRLESLSGKPTFTEVGTYTVSGTAIQTNFQLTPYEVEGLMFMGCVDDIDAWVTPYYRIEDLAGNIVFQQVDDTGITSNAGIVQYQIDWTGIADGTYKIVFNDGILEYESYCLCLKEGSCTILIDWTNASNAYGFDYSELEFNPVVRVEGKLWKPTYPSEVDSYLDNSGTGSLISSRTRKRYLLSIERQPEYIHDAIAIGLLNDTVKVDGLQVVKEEDEYAPKWVNSSNLASVETEVFVKILNLNNTRCGGTLE